MEIDCDLKSMQIIENGSKSLSAYDLRKFKKFQEFKLSTQVQTHSLYEEGLKFFITKNGRVALCKEYDSEIKSLLELGSKESLKNGMRVEAVRDS
jgi:hypothetical protein